MLLKPNTVFIVSSFGASIDETMEYSAKKESEFTDYLLQKACSFLSTFSALAKELDWRKSGRAVYNLGDMLFVCHIAIMAGKTTIKAIRNYWEEYWQELAKIKTSLSAVPSITRLQTMFTMIDVEQFSDLMGGVTIDSYIRNRKADGNYTTTVLSERDVVGADGQNINASQVLKKNQKFNDDGTGKAKRTSGYDITSLYSYRYGMSLRQILCQKKNQERASIVVMLEENKEAFKNTIITFDALNTHNRVLDKILDCDADYFASLKANQKSLYEEIELQFEKNIEKYRDEGILITGDFDTSNGNFDIRTTVYILPANVLDAKVIKKAQGIKSIVMFRSYVTNKTVGDMIIPVRYFITSLEADINENPDVAMDFNKIRLMHWGIETSHSYLDENLDQDNRSFKNDASASNRTQLYKIVLNAITTNRKMLQENEAGYVSLNDVICKCQSDPLYAINVLADSIGFDLQLRERGIIDTERTYIYDQEKVVTVTRKQEAKEDKSKGKSRFITEVKTFRPSDEDAEILDMERFLSLMGNTMFPAKNLRIHRYRELENYDLEKHRKKPKPAA